jgi:pimeloyl-ACP methyl ester carboxylesterase
MIMNSTLSPTDSLVRSADGTDLALHSLGDGPGLVIVHGAMQTGTSQLDLARLLADGLRVHLLDRRGRGGSGGESATSTAQEVADLGAVIDATGARYAFGVSSGALIVARAALANPRLERIGLFEPPLSIGGSMRLDRAPRVVDALDAGKLPAAMAEAMKVAEMGPPWMFGLPAPLLAAASRARLRTPEAVRTARGLRADFAVVMENADTLDDFAAITARTLLVGGTATRPYLARSVAALAVTIPGARRVELEGQWHSATQNADEFGHPELVAPAVADFF